MNNLFDLRGRDVWLLGGAGYLGTASIKQLVLHGARVLCADIDGRDMVGEPFAILIGEAVNKHVGS